MGGDSVRVEKLKGDASTRTYFRIRSGDQSFILMRLAEPDAFKKSEEQVTSQTIPVEELPFLNIQRHLYRCGVSVPKIFFYERERGVLLLEDVGDLLLEEIVRGIDEESRWLYYQKAIDELIRLQISGTRERDAGCIAFGRCFDVPLLMWECDHFLEYGVEGYKKKVIAPGDREAIRKILLTISERVAAEPRCFTHRDYHSRNLVVQNGRIRVLDFQDALMGPCQYDLASLLRDSYTVLSDPLRERLLGYYIQKKEEAEERQIGREEFQMIFDLVGLQRNLKAAGRFAYINLVKGNDRYLQYIPDTLGYVKNTLSRYPEFFPLKQLLGQYVEELL